MNKTYILYIHICPNNKIYIGITKQNVNKRWRNGKGYIGNKFFYKAIKKYGWENIKHKILHEELSKEEAEQKEKEYIKIYKSNNSKYGYNIESGGLESPKSKISRKKANKTKKGKTPWNKGKKMSKDFCLKIKKAKQGKGLNKNLLNKIRLPVKCLETGKIYISISDASKKTNINVSNIARVCKNKRKTAGGYHWKYEKEKLYE